MAGWDGAGNFTVNYSFVADAAAGIKILASKQDTQWATVVAGLMNCQTRDGQNKPSANWDFNAKRITNLAAGVASTDAVNVSQLASNSWLSEPSIVTWVAATQVKVVGIDVTTRYAIGRRVQFLDNAISRTATVIASVFVTDTTLTLKVDGGSALTGATTVFTYGLEPIISPSIFKTTKIRTGLQTGVNLTTGVAVRMNGASSATVDPLNEWDNAGRFTAKVAGTYTFSGVYEIRSAAGTTGVSGQSQSIGLGKNGVASIAAGTSNSIFWWPFADSLARGVCVSINISITLVAGDTVDVYAIGTFTGTALTCQGDGLSIDRVDI